MLSNYSWISFKIAKIVIYSAPILFYKPLASMIGPNAPIFIPKVAQPVEEHLSDYEVELTIVIGKAAKDVSEADALDYVLGYTGANDVKTFTMVRRLSDLISLTIGIIPQAPNDNFPVGILQGVR